MVLPLTPDAYKISTGLTYINLNYKGYNLMKKEIKIVKTLSTKPTSQVEVLVDNKNLYSKDNIKIQANLSLDALHASAKKKGESDSRLIISLLAAHKNGNKHINKLNDKSTVQNDNMIRNNSILIDSFSMCVREIKPDSTKTKVVPITGVMQEDVNSMKSAINRVTPFVVYVIRQDLFNEISLSNEGLLVVSGKILIPSQIADKVIDKEMNNDKLFTMDSKQAAFGVYKGDTIQPVKVNKSLSSLIKNASEVLKVEKVKRNVDKDTTKPSPVTKEVSQSLTQNIDMLTGILAKQESLKDFSKGVQDALNSLTLQVLRLNHYEQVTTDKQKVLKVSEM